MPEDARILYGDRIEFIARGLGIGGVSPSGFAPVVDRIVDLAVELRDEGVEAISLMGTSISFYRGAALTEQLRAEMTAASGLPCTTISHAVVAALRALGARRVAVATSYIEELNGGRIPPVLARMFWMDVCGRSNSLPIWGRVQPAFQRSHINAFWLSV